MMQLCKIPCDVCFSAKPENQELILIIDRGMQLIPGNIVEVLEVKNTPAIQVQITFKVQKGDTV